jgi:predicted adenylyl cyclase CyaB
MGEHRQGDTYFRVSHGRLKLRRIGRSPRGTLIYYDRPDRAESRYSEYHLALVDDAEEVETLLGSALGTLVKVDKTRHLFLYSATRIHLDRVENLGCFVELETVMQYQTEEEARAEHELVKQTLGLDEREIVAVSYGDLLQERSRRP